MLHNRGQWFVPRVLGEGCSGSFHLPSSPGEKQKIQDSSLKHSHLKSRSSSAFLKKGKATTETNKSHWIPFCHSSAETVNVNLSDNDLLLFKRKQESRVKDELRFPVKLMFPNRKAPADRAPQTVVCLHPDVSKPHRKIPMKPETHWAAAGKLKGLQMEF